MQRKRKLDQVNNIECPPEVSRSEWEQYKDVIRGIAACGFPRVGALCSHAYCGVPEPCHLKGQDALVYKIMSALCAPASLLIVPLVEVNKDRLYHASILPLMQESTTFSAVLSSDRENEDDEAEDEEEDQECEKEGSGGIEEEDRKDGSEQQPPQQDDDIGGGGSSKELKLKPQPTSGIQDQLGVFERMLTHNKDVLTQRFRDPAVKYDDDDTFQMVADDPRYRLGDVFFIRNPHVGKTKLYSGREDVHLGNEGFGGEIYDLVGIVGRLPTEMQAGNNAEY